MINDLCAVCLDDLDGLLYEGPCGHAVHRACADAMMHHACGRACPLCRATWRESECDDDGDAQYDYIARFFGAVVIGFRAGVAFAVAYV